MHYFCKCMCYHAKTELSTTNVDKPLSPVWAVDTIVKNDRNNETKEKLMPMSLNEG